MKRERKKKVAIDRPSLKGTIFDIEEDQKQFIDNGMNCLVYIKTDEDGEIETIRIGTRFDMPQGIKLKKKAHIFIISLSLWLEAKSKYERGAVKYGGTKWIH